MGGRRSRPGSPPTSSSAFSRPHTPESSATCHSRWKRRRPSKSAGRPTWPAATATQAAAAPLWGRLHSARRLGQRCRDPASPGIAAVGTVWAFEPGHGPAGLAGHLQVPTAHAGVAVVDGRAWLIGGEGRQSLGTVQVLQPNRTFGSRGARRRIALLRGPAADRRPRQQPPAGPRRRQADRLGLPERHHPGRPAGVLLPRRRLLHRHGRRSSPTRSTTTPSSRSPTPPGRSLVQYGHPKQAGTAPGYLNKPDDAYLLAQRRDHRRRRPELPGLVIDPRTARVRRPDRHRRRAAIRQPASIDGVTQRRHPALGRQPAGVGDQRIWVERVHARRRLVWTVHLPIGYPSDPQQLEPPPQRTLTAT